MFSPWPSLSKWTSLTCSFPLHTLWQGWELWIILGWGGSQVQKKCGVEFTFLLLYACLVREGLKFKKANRIWKFTFSYCILVSRSSYRWYSLIELLTHKYDVYSLTKIVQMSIHLPVPVPYIHCDRGGVGRGWGSSSSSSLLISPLTKFVQMNITYSWWPMVVEWNLLSNRTINTQIWCLVLDQVCPNEHHLPVPSPCIHCGRDGGHPPPPHCSQHQLWMTTRVGVGWEVILLLLYSPTKFLQFSSETKLTAIAVCWHSLS